MTQECVRRTDRGFFVRNPNVDVQRVDDLEPGEGAQFLLHPLVTLPAGEPLGEGVGDRVQPRGRDLHSRLVRRLRDLEPESG